MNEMSIRSPSDSDSIQNTDQLNATRMSRGSTMIRSRNPEARSVGNRKATADIVSSRPEEKSARYSLSSAVSDSIFHWVTLMPSAAPVRSRSAVSRTSAVSKPRTSNTSSNRCRSNGIRRKSIFTSATACSSST